MEKLGIIGLGYVGLPVTLEFSKAGFEVVGFDTNPNKIKQLIEKTDPIKEGLEEEIGSTKAVFTDDPKTLASCTTFILCVPSPVDENKNPDLTPIKDACLTVGAILKKGDLVILESTVYPGVTEDFCGKILRDLSGLEPTVDFSLGYSPERINPGDPNRKLPDIMKVVAADSEGSLKRITALYSKIIRAGVFQARSIKVAEAAKVIENTQRDLNIGLMNELAMIFDKIGISIRDVIEAAKTKWNFLPFIPGLVGGHCIGVDPYYLTTKAESLGYHPQVILAGRRINDSMGAWIAQKIVKLLIKEEIAPKGAKIGIFGITFKENISDSRNSKVVDVIRELTEFGAKVTVWDPLVNLSEAEYQYGLKISEPSIEFDCLVIAVAHNQFKDPELIKRYLKRGGIVVDIKGIFNQNIFPDHIYWSL